MRNRDSDWLRLICVRDRRGTAASLQRRLPPSPYQWLPRDSGLLLRRFECRARQQRVPFLGRSLPFTRIYAGFLAARLLKDHTFFFGSSREAEFRHRRSEYYQSLLHTPNLRSGRLNAFPNLDARGLLCSHRDVAEQSVTQRSQTYAGFGRDLRYASRRQRAFPTRLPCDTPGICNRCLLRTGAAV